MNRGDILDEAKRLTMGDRRGTYGDPFEMHSKIAAGWSALLGVDVTAHQVAACMAWLKLCRAVQSPDHLDSAVDAAAYAAIMGEIAAGRPQSS